MRWLLCRCLGLLICVAVVPLDLCLKMAVGMGLVLLLWLPFGDLASGLSPPWRYACLVAGLCFIGFWDCCDLFGLYQLGEWAQNLGSRGESSAPGGEA